VLETPFDSWNCRGGMRPALWRMADTTRPHGQLMLTILGGLAEFERTLIRARTGEGRERAEAGGVRFGRPKKLSAHQRREAIDRINAGEAVAEVARTFGDRVSAETVAAGNLLLNAEIELEPMIEQVLSAAKRKR
jgi:DNA invertase Pin-like site-specific DNA recombinase